MISPQIMHIPCDLNQQHDRAVAARARLVRALRRRRRGGSIDVPNVELHLQAEDVSHSLRF